MAAAHGRRIRHSARSRFSREMGRTLCEPALRLAYLSPEVFKRLVFKREIPASTMLQLNECAALPWSEQEGVVFGEAN